MEDRVRDTARIRQMRLARLDALQASHKSQLLSVLNSDDENLRQIYVVKLLDVHPRLGKVQGRRLLTSLGVSHFDRVSDLSAAVIDKLAFEIGESQ